MLFIDVKYASLLSSRLRNFKKKQDYLWNFSCPVCGDSSKNKLKARGYIYRTKTDLFVKCHNCQYGANLGNFIKTLDENLYNDYVVERYKSGATRYNAHKDISVVIPKEVILVDSVLADLKQISQLGADHPAVQYCVKRKIPEHHWDVIYFCKAFKKWTNSVKFTFTNEEHDHPRLIFPFFNEHGKVFAFSGRAFGNEQPKYITIKLDETKEKIYGLERIDYSKKVYVVEGQIDSLFLSNSIAVSGASFDLPTIQALKTNCTIVMDNEPRNKEIVKQLEKYIDEDYAVCMFPSDIEEKDINEMILSGKTVEQIIDVINRNTYQGLSAKMHMASWKKC